jgi:serine O-acetyltransferase
MNLIVRTLRHYTDGEYLARKNTDFCRWLNRMLNSCEIGCDVPQSIRLIHNGIGVVFFASGVGENVVIYPHVLIGTKDISYIEKNPKLPKIGSNVIIGTGSVIVGDITIGDNSVIGANSFIDRDIPKDSIVYTKRKLVIKQR